MWRTIFKHLAYPSLILRVIVPPLIFINPFLISFVNLFLDWIDGQFWYQNKISKINYDLLDKSLDLYSYVFALIYSYFYLPYFFLLLLLFLIRLVGQIVFYYKKSHRYFLYFPNFFEVAFLVILFFGNSNNLLYFLIIAFLVKVVQEYFLHKILFDKRSIEKMPEIFRGPDK